MANPIDIRAIVTVNGIRSISGSISDSYITGAGLITTTGEFTLVGIHNFSPGYYVQILFENVNGVVRNIPRRLRVLSCSSNPFDNTTNVAVACPLEYARESKALPTDEGVTSILTSQQLNCLNDYEYPPFSDYPPPIYSRDIAQECLTKMGILGGPPGGTMVWYLDEFKFDQPYFDILNNILLSESLAAHVALGAIRYFDPISGSSSAGNGVLGPNDIIAINPINSGEKIPDGAICNYTRVKLKLADPEEQTVTGGWNSDYSEEKTEGAPRTVKVTGSDGSVVSTGTYTPLTRTVQEYGEDQSWDSEACVLFSSVGERPDLSDKVIYKYEETRLCLAEVNERYAATAVEAEIEADIYRTDFRTTETWYEYDDRGNIIVEEEVVKEPLWALAGKMNFAWFSTRTGSLLPLGNSHYTIGRKRITYEYIYPEVDTNLRPKNVPVSELFSNYIAEPSEEVLGTITRTIEESHPLYFTSFQHARNLVSTDELDQNDLQQLVLAMAALFLMESDRQVRISNGRTKTKVVWRPNKTERTLKDIGYVEEESAELTTSGNTSSGSGFIEFSLPYQDMDYLTPDGVVLPGRAQSQAASYIRTQMGLIKGHRYGVNIQTSADRLLVTPGSIINVKAGSGYGGYIVDGTTYSWDSSGIVASTDALLQGGITNNPASSFFPISGGGEINIDPPATINYSNNIIIGSAPLNESNPSDDLNLLFPGATSGDVVVDEGTNNNWISDGAGNWENVGTFLGEVLAEETGFLAVYDIVEKIVGLVRSNVFIRTFDYALSIGPINLPISVKTKLTTTIIINVLDATVTIGAADAEENGALAIAGDVAQVVTVSPDLEFVGDLYNVFFDFADVLIQGIPFADPGDILETQPSAAYVVYSFDALGTGGAISSNPPYNIEASVYGDISQGNLPVLSTAQSKFGGSSIYWDGADQDYLEFETPNFVIGSFDFTIEFWLYIPSTGDPYGSRYCTPYSMNGGNGPALWLEFETTSSIRYVSLAVGDWNTSWDYYVVSQDLAWNFDEWTHICITRVDGEIWLAVNGIFLTQNYSGSGDPIPVPFSADLTSLKHGLGNVNQNEYYDLYGYIDEFRLTIGKAVYGTDDFVPPTEPFTDELQASLVFLFNEGVGITDVMSESPYRIEPPPAIQGTPVLSDTEVLFGDSALYFDNTGVTSQENRLLFTNPLHFGTGDYCVEMWVYVSSDAQDNEYDTLIDLGDGFSIDIDVNTTSYAPHAFTCYHYLNVTSGNEVYEGPGDNDTFGDFDTWTHIAAFRLNGNHYIAINGIVDSNYIHEELVDVYDFQSSPSARNCGLGTWPANSDNVGDYNLSKVYIDSFKMTAQDAVYSDSGFTPPAEEFSVGSGQGPTSVSVLIPLAQASVLGLAPGGTVEGGVLIDYPDFTSVTGLELISTYDVSGGVIYLTNTSGNDVGNIWTSTSYLYNYDFSVEWIFECSGGDPGADGFTIQWHTLNNVNGGLGNFRGRASDPAPRHAIGFGTFNFGGPQFVTWHQNGSQSSYQNSTLALPGFRQNVYYWLDYDHAAQTMSVYYSTTSTKPGTASHTYTSFLFDNNTYYMGFGASTGGYTDNHIIKKWIVNL